MRTDYGNWVSSFMMKCAWGISFVLLILGLSSVFLIKSIIVYSIIFILFALTLAVAVYMQICRYEFSFTGGRVMGKIHEFLLSKLNWSGMGNMIDIGCGSGALTICCAKKYPRAHITGIDYWGAEWSYGKEQCERNAKIENIDSIDFMRGDAAQLPFNDDCFDAAVSNFVFHEVKSQPDKRLVVKEALRVVKKGGTFVFQDMFEQKNLYGDMQEFINELKSSGIREIHYEPHTENLSFIPSAVKLAPWMLRDMGIMYGVK